MYTLGKDRKNIGIEQRQRVGMMSTDFNNAFDTTNAMFALFLWLLFGFLSHMINCDLQRMIENSMIVRHIIGLIAFFFLFTLLDGNNKTNIQTIFIKTFLVYILFILTTKSKWYFALPVLGLLMVDQVLKRIYEDRKNFVADAESDAFLQRHKHINWWINIIVIILIIIGMLHYMYLQKIEYGKKFTYFKFFFKTNKRCKPYHPDYKNLMNKKL